MLDTAAHRTKELADLDADQEQLQDQTLPFAFPSTSLVFARSVCSKRIVSSLGDGSSKPRRIRSTASTVEGESFKLIVLRIEI